MGTDDRVVLRSAIAGAALSAAVSVLALAGLAWAFDDWFVLWACGGGVVIGTLLGHLLRRVVLTSRGLEVRSLGHTFVPWSQISDVSAGGSRWTERYVAVLTLPYGARTKLAAPRATLGIGDRSVDAARDLVEHWWLLHRGEATEPTQPSTVPHDPWAPPPA